MHRRRRSNREQPDRSGPSGTRLGSVIRERARLGSLCLPPERSIPGSVVAIIGEIVFVWIHISLIDVLLANVVQTSAAPRVDQPERPTMPAASGYRPSCPRRRLVAHSVD